VSEKRGGWEKKLYKSRPYLRPSPIICVRITQNAEFWYSKPQNPENKRGKKDISDSEEGRGESLKLVRLLHLPHIEP